MIGVQGGGKSLPLVTERERCLQPTEIRVLCGSGGVTQPGSGWGPVTLLQGAPGTGDRPFRAGMTE